MALRAPEGMYLFWLWARRDFLARYAGSVGGVVWALLLPFMTVLLFYVIFALVLKVRVPSIAGETGYFYFLLAGLLPWLTAVEGLSRAVSALAGQEQFLQKLVFPVGLLPTTAVFTSLVPQVVGTLIFVVVLAWQDLLVWDRLLWLPPLLALQMLMLLGLGLSLAVFGLYLRDLIQVFPVLMQFFFYTSPILFPKSAVPERFHDWFLFNPFSGLIEAYQYVFVGIPLGTGPLLAMLFWALVLGVGGILLFRFLKPSLGDYL